MLFRSLRSLVDPNQLMVRTPPSSVDNLLFGGNNNWVQCYDNLSNISPSLSDTMCTMSTGGGVGNRKLYTDSLEYVNNICVPFLLNGIGDLATRGDLVDRSIIVNLPQIDKENRKSENDLFREFTGQTSALLGSIFDIISSGLKNLPSVKLEKSNRLYDFTRWICACEDALPWGNGTFVKIYDEATEENSIDVIENDLFATTLIKYGSWLKIHNIGEKSNNGHIILEGSAQEILEHLSVFIQDDTGNMYKYKLPEYWPKTSQGTGRKLMRILPEMGKIGIELYKNPRNHGGKRSWTITYDMEQVENYSRGV